MNRLMYGHSTCLQNGSIYIKCKKYNSFYNQKVNKVNCSLHIPSELGAEIRVPFFFRDRM